jgi:hypothetical protein
LRNPTPEVYGYWEAGFTGYAVGHARVGEEVAVQLTYGGEIEGHVEVAGGVPFAGSSVTIIRRLNGESSLHSAGIDENGYYRITELMDGAHRVQMSIKDNAGNRVESYYFEDTLEVVDGRVTTYDIAIPAGSAVVSGTLLDRGVPVPNQNLRCKLAGYHLYDSTDQAGHYRFDRIPNGLVQISAIIRQPENPGFSNYVDILDINVAPGTEIVHDADLSKLD